MVPAPDSIHGHRWRPVSDAAWRCVCGVQALRDDLGVTYRIDERPWSGEEPLHVEPPADDPFGGATPMR